METTMYLFLIIGFVQLVSTTPTSISDPASPAQQPSSSAHKCPKIPNYFPLLLLTLGGDQEKLESFRIGSEALKETGMPCILKHLKMYNEDGTVNFEAYKKVVLESPEIFSPPNSADAETQLNRIKDCFSQKGADEFETYKLLWSCAESKWAELKASNNKTHE